MKHRCKLCDMSRAIESGPLNSKQKAAIEYLWARAEAAETDIAMMEVCQGGWRVILLWKRVGAKEAMKPKQQPVSLMPKWIVITLTTDKKTHLAGFPDESKADEHVAYIKSKRIGLPTKYRRAR